MIGHLSPDLLMLVHASLYLTYLTGLRWGPLLYARDEMTICALIFMSVTRGLVSAAPASASAKARFCDRDATR